MEITIRMKSGSPMTVEADAHAYTDSDGAGQTYQVVEDLICYWPRRDGKGKWREIPPKMYDTALAEEAYWNAAD